MTILYFKRFWELFVEKHVFFNASAITFYLIISSIPFSLIITSILGFVLSNEQALQQLTRFMQDFLPGILLEGEEGVIDLQLEIMNLLNPLIERRRVYGLLGFGILTFTSLGLFAAVKHVLFDIFDIEENEDFFKELLYELIAFGVAGGVFIFFSVVVSVISIVATETISIPYVDIEINLGFFYELIAVFLPVLFNVLLFYVFFRYVSRRHIERLTSLFGAVVYTLLFEIARNIFGFYVGHALTHYQYLYQSYTIVLMLGLWALYGAITFTISAIAARAFYDVRMKKNQIDVKK